MDIKKFMEQKQKENIKLIRDILNAISYESNLEKARALIEEYFDNFLFTELKKCDRCGKFGIDEEDGFFYEDDDTWFCNECGDIMEARGEWMSELYDEYENE